MENGLNLFAYFRKMARFFVVVLAAFLAVSDAKAPSGVAVCRKFFILLNHSFNPSKFTYRMCMNVTSFSVFHTEATVSIGLKNVFRMVTVP